MPSEDERRKILALLRGTPQHLLRSGVEKTEGLSPEDEEALERGGRHVQRATMRRIGRWSLWSLFGIGLLTALGILAGVGYVTYSHINEMVSTGKSGQMLSQMLGFLSGIAVTLAVQLLWYIGRGKVSSD